MGTSQLRLAISPLPWIFTSDSSRDLSEANIRQSLLDVGSAGFSALHADIPPGMTVAGYSSMLGEYGFSSAPGYFQAFVGTSA